MQVTAAFPQRRHKPDNMPADSAAEGSSQRLFRAKPPGQGRGALRAAARPESQAVSSIVKKSQPI